jgi:DNA mismatch endonuclease (patch repair protein)
MRNSRYWKEKLDRNQSRDARNTAALEASGWLVLRYWEHDQTEAAADEIRATVLKRRTTSA